MRDTLECSNQWWIAFNSKRKCQQNSSMVEVVFYQYLITSFISESAVQLGTSYPSLPHISSCFFVVFVRLTGAVCICQAGRLQTTGAPCYSFVILLRRMFFVVGEVKNGNGIMHLGRTEIV